MLRTRIFWAIVLGIVSLVLIFEAKTNLAYGAVGTRVFAYLAAPGSHLASALSNSASFAGEGWTRVWAGLAIACNFLTYLFFWYVGTWIIGHVRKRQHPYEDEGTLVPPGLR